MRRTAAAITAANDGEGIISAHAENSVTAFVAIAVLGIISAHAENSTADSNIECGVRDHLRACGEQGGSVGKPESG